MHLSRLSLLSALACFGTLGCATSHDEADGADDSFLSGGKADDAGVTEGSREARAVLRLVNRATRDVLDFEVPLDSRAANNIVAFRAGADGVADTEDDRVFATLAELDAISYVGPVAFENMLEYVHARTLADVLPAGPFSVELEVEVPVTVSSWNSAQEWGPYQRSNPQDTTRTQRITLHGDGTRLQITTDPPGLRGITTVTLADGAFTMSFREDGITSDNRRTYFDEVILSGEVDPLGELVVTRYYQIGGSGNQALGWRGSVTESRGEGFAALPTVAY